MFKTNEGSFDRVARVVVGVILIAAFFMFPNLLGAFNWVLWIGVIPLVTGLVGWCPLYSVFGISTCPLKTS